jgi:hypothetical protein
MKNYQLLLLSFLFFGTGYSIMNGTAQEWVHFAGPMNELGCTVISLSLGILMIVGLDFKGLFKWLFNKI